MDRRDFVRLAGSGMAAGALAETLVLAQAARTPAAAKTAGASSSKVKFHVGTQHGDSDDILKAMAAFGCNHICGSMPSRQLDEKWSVESLSRHREKVESYGIKLDMMPITMTSASIDRAEMPAIFLAGPERDRNIEDICTQIRNCAKAGIFHVKYNFTILGIPRTGRSKGRGPSTYSEFVFANDKNKDTLTLAGKVSEDEYWERITYFLERVVPVAEEYKVKLGCHPQDPGVPRNYRGLAAVPLATPAGLKRFVSIKESPYHGLNFCQGTVSEQLEKPGEQTFDVIRDLGGRKKIFNVHFRNIEGGYLNFRETFIDNGSVDMLKAARVYKEVGYEGMLMPDHVPNVDGDPDHMQGFAFAIGYIKAIIAAVSAEA
jgi:mannonate dehydratase